MAISFIVTTYNVEDYIAACLASIHEVVQPGDELIVIDDGSDDETPRIVHEALAAQDPEKGINHRTVFLGANTPGGVGIAANIGLSLADRDTVFFVDGDDWINPQGFTRARATWTFNQFDILFTNYLTFDSKTQTSAPPADNPLWSAIRHDTSGDDIRLQALAFIGVPWRKFYRRAFLESHDLRFPEGDFFFEDNPFHWQVCCKARAIGFTDRLTCFHRVNRPGQTLASTGVELLAFFIHFETIWAQLPDHDNRYPRQACLWLLENMAWHIGRLSPEARHAYASAANTALAMVPSVIWDETRKARPPHDPVFLMADRLRNGGVDAQIASWDRADIHRSQTNLDAQLQALTAQTTDIRQSLLGTAAARQFQAIWTQRQQNQK